MMITCPSKAPLLQRESPRRRVRVQAQPYWYRHVARTALFSRVPLAYLNRGQTGLGGHDWVSFRPRALTRQASLTPTFLGLHISGPGTWASGLKEFPPVPPAHA